MLLRTTPPLRLVILVALVGPNLFSVMAVIALLSWPGLTRLVRGQVLSLRQQQYVEAARALGARGRRVVLRSAAPAAERRMDRHPVQPGRHPGRRSAGDRRAWRLCRGWRTQHRRPDQGRAAPPSGGRATYLGGNRGPGGDGLRLLPSAVLPGRNADRSHQHRHILDVLSSASEHRERSLGDLHVLRVVASTDANAADNLVAEFERISTTKNDEPIDSCWRAGSQG